MAPLTRMRAGSTHIPKNEKWGGSCIVHGAVRASAANPECGEPLQRELEGLRNYRVYRFRIVYTVDQKRRIIRLMAVGHRRSVYEELTERILRKPRA